MNIKMTQGFYDATTDAQWLISDIAVILNTKVNDQYCTITLNVKENKGDGNMNNAVLVMNWDEEVKGKTKVKQHTQKYNHTFYPCGNHTFTAVRQDGAWVLMLSSEF